MIILTWIGAITVVAIIYVGFNHFFNKIKETNKGDTL